MAGPRAPSPTVVVVGLGPAGSPYLTAGAEAALEAAEVLYLRTAEHPAAVPYLGRAIALDDHYEGAQSFATASAAIVETLVAAAARHQRITYAVPGSPGVLERTVELLRADPRVTCEIIPGMSFLELAFVRLGVDPVNESVRLVDAQRFARDAAGERGPLLICQTWSRALLSDLKVAVETPPAGPVVVLHHLGLPDERIVTLAWEELDRDLEPDHLTCVYLPALAPPVGFELLRAVEIVRTLRLSCPWDAAQTHNSLVRHLLEETYEAIEAIEQLGEDPGGPELEHLIEELGDVLCQVLFHSAIAEQEGRFNLADVASGLGDKLVRRHPHVFSSIDAPPADAVLAGWEQAKQAEKGRASLLDGIPARLPALALADKLERRAATVGRGWPAGADGADLLAEALGALLDGDPAGAGGLLFSLARLVAHLGGDPEQAVRDAARAFGEAFRAIEARSARPASGPGGEP